MSSITVDLHVAEITDIHTPLIAVDGIVNDKPASIAPILSDDGAFELTVIPDAACRPYLTKGRCVTFSVGGEVLAAGLIRYRSDHRISEEEGKEDFKVWGPTFFGVTDKVSVRPTLGYGKFPFGPARDFGWFSPEYDPTGIFVDTAVPITPTLDAGGYNVYSYWSDKPSGFPAITGSDIAWIGPIDDDTQASTGYVYFLKRRTFADPFFLRAFLAADNKVLNFADGFNIPTSTNLDSTTQGFTTAADYYLRGDAAEHVFGMKVTNVEPTTGADPGFGEGSSVLGNPMGLLGGWWNVTAAGELVERLFQTDDSWLMLAYPDVAPGMAVSQVARIILAEGHAEGLVTFLDTDATDYLDSAGNAMDIIEIIPTQVGDSLDKLLKEWGQTFCDSRIDYSVPQLQLFRLGEAGVDSGVTFPVDTDRDVATIIDLRVDEDNSEIDCLTVRWSGGPDIRVPATGGTSKGLLKTGAKTVTDAYDFGVKALAAQALPDQFTYKINPTGVADLPGRDALLGDIIHPADGLGGTVAERMIGYKIIVTGDDSFWEVTVKDRNLSGVEALNRLIQQQLNGTLGGTASSQPAPDPTRYAPQNHTRDDTIQFDQDAMPGSSLETDVPESGNLWAVSIRATATFASDVEFLFKVDGSDMLGGLGVLPAGRLYAVVPVAPFGSVTTKWVAARSSRVQAVVTSAGSVDCGNPGSGIVIKGLYVS